MNLESKLAGRNLKWNWDNIAKDLMRNPANIPELIQHAKKGEKIIIQNASAIIGKISDKKPALIAPFYIELIDHLSTNPIDAYKRCIMRIFQTENAPEEREGELFEIALNFLNSVEEAIAIKAFSLTSARRIAEKYPELAQEVLHITEIIVEEKLSAGMTNRGNKELQILRKLCQN